MPHYMSRRILIAEDEPKITRMLESFLSSRGFECISADSGRTAVESLRQIGADVVLMDWMLPDLDGLEAVRQIREFSRIPVIMLTAKDRESDKVTGLESGADDYITKPFSLKELAARIGVQLRRQVSGGTEDSEEITVTPFRLNTVSRRAWKGSHELKLTTMRFDLLAVFLKQPGRVFTREQIMDHLGGKNLYEGFDRTIDAHIKNLRKQTEEHPSSPRYILTVRGVGYKFQGDPQ